MTEGEHIYQISVEGMNKEEYYQFDSHFEPEEVKDIWLAHGISRIGRGMLSIKDRVSVKKINEPPEQKELKDGEQLN